MPVPCHTPTPSSELRILNTLKCSRLAILLLLSNFDKLHMLSTLFYFTNSVKQGLIYPTKATLIPDTHCLYLIVYIKREKKILQYWYPSFEHTAAHPLCICALHSCSTIQRKLAFTRFAFTQIWTYSINTMDLITKKKAILVVKRKMKKEQNALGTVEVHRTRKQQYHLVTM